MGVVSATLYIVRLGINRRFAETHHAVAVRVGVNQRVAVVPRIASAIIVVVGTHATQCPNERSTPATMGYSLPQRSMPIPTIEAPAYLKMRTRRCNHAVRCLGDVINKSAGEALGHGHRHWTSDVLRHLRELGIGDCLIRLAVGKEAQIRVPVARLPRADGAAVCGREHVKPIGRPQFRGQVGEAVGDGGQVRRPVHVLLAVPVEVARRIDNDIRFLFILSKIRVCCGIRTVGHINEDVVFAHAIFKSQR